MGSACLHWSTACPQHEPLQFISPASWHTLSPLPFLEHALLPFSTTFYKPVLYNSTANVLSPQEESWFPSERYRREKKSHAMFSVNLWASSEIMRLAGIWEMLTSHNPAFLLLSQLTCCKYKCFPQGKKPADSLWLFFNRYIVAFLSTLIQTMFYIINIWCLKETANVILKQT